MPDPIDIDSNTLLADVERHFRVSAGPGAGKTHWLVNHITSVVERSTRLSPVSRIACISYTNIAVAEIVRRLGAAAARVDVATIHSFLYRYVLRPYLHLLRDSDGSPLFASDRLDGHDKHHPSYTKLRDWVVSIGASWLLQKKFEKQLNLVKDKVCSLSWRRSGDGVWELLPRDTDHMGPKTRDVCASANLIAYKRLYWNDGILDHEDVLYFAHRILEEHPFVCECLSARYRYLYIDEFQDTLPTQTAIVKWLAAAGTVVGVIGDAQQSIYGFLDAHPDDFREFALPDHIPVTMRQNRRSTERVIKLIDHVRSDGFQQECVRNAEGEPILIVLGDVNRCLDAIRSRIPEGGELRVLTRNNSHARRIRSTLGANSADPWPAFEKADAERARFMERLIRAGELARRGEYALALRDFVRIIGRTGEVRKPLRCDRALTEIERRGLCVDLLEQLMSHYSDVDKGSLLEAYERCVEWVGEACNDLALSGVKTGKFKTFAEKTKYRVLADAVELDEESRHVRTIHKAKGTEAQNVVVLLEDAERVRHITHPTSLDDEEKRITYVALSRAQDRLFLCIPDGVEADLVILQSLGMEIMDLRDNAASTA